MREGLGRRIGGGLNSSRALAEVPEPFFRKYILLDIILVSAPILSAIQASQGRLLWFLESHDFTCSPRCRDFPCLKCFPARPG